MHPGCLDLDAISVTAPRYLSVCVCKLGTLKVPTSQGVVKNRSATIFKVLRVSVELSAMQRLLILLKNFTKCYIILIV